MTNTPTPTPKTTSKTMPNTPFVGLTFRPFGTDAVGVVTDVHGRDVTYRFEHDGSPTDAPRYTRGYGELKKLAFKL